jgi:hypothetical protein
MPPVYNLGMTIIASTDKRPVYLDSLGNPASFGRLIYYAKGTSNLKTVYTDPTRLVPCLNPLVLDLSARTPTQVFLGVGDYEVQLEVFIGTDIGSVDTALIPSPYFAPDHFWLEQGDVNASVNLGDQWVVNTVDDLRAVNPIDHTSVSVIGYFNTTDCPQRTYNWVLGATAFDNGGSSILHNADGSGAWLLNVSGDCREWGIIPNRPGAINSQFQIAASYFSTVIMNPTELYFPAGEYKVAGGSTFVNCDIHLASRVTFSVISGNYALSCFSGFRNDGIEGLGSNMAGTMTLTLNDPYLRNPHVNLQWWDFTGAGLEVAETARTMSVTLAPGYIVNVTKPYTWASSVSVSIKNPIMFGPNGSFNMTGVGNLETINSVFLQLGASNVFRGAIGRLSFGKEIRTSWFADTAGITSNLSHTLAYLTGASQGTVVIFDAAISRFQDYYADTTKLQYRYESGLIQVTADSVELSSLEGWGKGCVTGPLRVHNQVSYVDMWYQGGAYDTAFGYALQSASEASCILDLGGKTLTLSVPKQADLKVNHLTIRNGGVSMGTSGTYPFWFNNGTGAITFENVDYTANSSSVASMLVVGTSCNPSKVTFDRVVFVGSGGKLLASSGTGNVSRVTITNSRIVAGLLNTGISTSYLITGSSLNCASNLDSSNVVMSDCQVSSPIGSFTVSGSPKMKISNNYFDCHLYVVADEEVSIGGTPIGYSIQGTIIGNTFRDSFVNFFASQANTIFSGLTAVGNHFAKTMDNAGIPCFTTATSVGSWGTTWYSFNSLKITGNSSSKSYVEQTEGTSSLIVDVFAGNQAGSTNLAAQSNKFFIVPGGMPTFRCSGMLAPGATPVEVVAASSVSLSGYIYSIKFNVVPGASSTQTFQATFSLYGV